MSQRVRVIGGPWPERIGCEGTIVEAPRGYDRYPWAGSGRNEVVVLLDHDPLTAPAYADNYGGQAWTCVIGRRDVEPVEEPTA